MFRLFFEGVAAPEHGLFEAATDQPPPAPAAKRRLAQAAADQELPRADDGAADGAAEALPRSPLLEPLLEAANPRPRPPGSSRTRDRAWDPSSLVCLPVSCSPFGVAQALDPTTEAKLKAVGRAMVKCFYEGRRVGSRSKSNTLSRANIRGCRSFMKTR